MIRPRDDDPMRMRPLPTPPLDIYFDNTRYLWVVRDAVALDIAEWDTHSDAQRFLAILSAFIAQCKELPGECMGWNALGHHHSVSGVHRADGDHDMPVMPTDQRVN